MTMTGPYQETHDCPTGWHDEPSINCYNHHGCRCGSCAREKRESQWEVVAEKRGREPPEHGTTWAYGTYGCRCDECRKAKRVYMRRYRAERQGE